MSYYVDVIGYNLKFKAEYLDRITKALRNYYELEQSYQDMDGIKILEKRGLYFEQSNIGEYHLDNTDIEGLYDLREMFGAISEFLTGEIEFRGEDDFHWKWEFNEGSMNEVEARILYGDEYELFISKYKNELPNKTMTELKKWWVLKNV